MRHAVTRLHAQVPVMAAREVIALCDWSNACLTLSDNSAAFERSFAFGPPSAVPSCCLRGALIDDPPASSYSHATPSRSIGHIRCPCHQSFGVFSGRNTLIYFPLHDRRRPSRSLAIFSASFTSSMWVHLRHISTCRTRDGCPRVIVPSAIQGRRSRRLPRSTAIRRTRSQALSWLPCERHAPA